MNIREYMNNNPAVITIGAVVVLVICLGFIIRTIMGGSSSAGGVVDVYFYDMNTGELFNAASNEFPPIQSPTDEGDQLSGVKAHVYSCGDCGDKSSRFIGYLERYTPEAKAKMEAARDSEQPIMEEVYEMNQGREIKRPDDAQWINDNSEEAMMLRDELRKRCNEGESVRNCFP